MKWLPWPYCLISSFLLMMFPVVPRKQRFLILSSSWQRTVLNYKCRFVVDLGDKPHGVPQTPESDPLAQTRKLNTKELKK